MKEEKQEKQVVKKKKKAKKINKKKLIILIVVILLLIAVLIPGIGIMRLSSKGYSFSSSFKLYFSGLKSYTLDKDYSKTLDNIIGTDQYEKKYLDNYLTIDFNEAKDFNETINTYLDLGYNSKEINAIYKKDDKELIAKLKNNYVNDIISFIEYPFFKTDKLERYIQYYQDNQDYRRTIIEVNIGIDKVFYDDPVVVVKYSNDMLVNKYNKLASTFVPDDLTELTECSGSGEYLAKEAKEAYDKMCEASKKDGMHLGVTSSYRSFEDQTKIYNSYLKSKGQSYVDQYVATPGYSEHQTGLALDVKSTVASPFKTTEEYTWMMDNAYKYGFILRYPEEEQRLTGYSPEAWHFRYVGEKIANYIHENNITYEEYCAMFM